jgi:hypothetical protein
LNISPDLVDEQIPQDNISTGTLWKGWFARERPVRDGQQSERVVEAVEAQ